ncbi:hypothetical protein CERZMDRAFT_87861 [Cercospora zeae-maydis SCOH1-5]|uniref:Uncharacterized protein n=1 Tax=Cercospora zeae-maydis SCOH1-5 TaxID=717836 RepID=A0A6A6F501_9PEZI|nr:hypothetical protein CERZMDRAFT_87861 [Cercospora zeae-maydis SCOH1-5]
MSALHMSLAGSRRDSGCSVNRLCPSTLSNIRATKTYDAFTPIIRRISPASNYTVPTKSNATGEAKSDTDGKAANCASSQLADLVEQGRERPKERLDRSSDPFGVTINIAMPKRKQESRCIAKGS